MHVPRIELDEGNSFEVMAGGDPPFPFFVAGFSVGEREFLPLDIDASMPTGICRFSHQYGGTSCLQASIIGYGAALTPELRRSVKLREMHVAWWKSAGAAFSSIELDELEAAFSTHGKFPRLARGEEGLLEFEECDPIAALQSCEVLSFGKDDAIFADWRERRVEPESVMKTLGPYSLAHDLLCFRSGKLSGRAGLGCITSGGTRIKSDPRNHSRRSPLGYAHLSHPMSECGMDARAAELKNRVIFVTS